jgi:agmatine/peptidylarginine deiminase
MTEAKDGRRLPAEWEDGGSALVAWPREGSGWRRSLSEARADCEALVRALLESARVLLLVPDDATGRALEDRLGEGGGERLRTAVLPYDDVWTRDTAPLAVREGGAITLVDFRFDAWGGKYPATNDDRLTERLLAGGYFGALRRERVETVLEGGNIESDGAGTILVRSRCLLDPRRNPGLGERTAWEALLARSLGARRLLWLERGALAGDDTDGHIDTLVRFAAPDLLVYQDGTEEDLSGELRSFRDHRGQPYTLVPLPPAPALRGEEGEPLPTNYCNFVLVPGRVLVPAYGAPSDTEARRRLASVFPSREALSVPARGLVHQYGSLHCATMTWPAGVLRTDGEARA